MTKVIVGCTGAIGGALLERLEQGGESIIGLSRSITPTCRGNVTLKACDIENSFQVRGAIPDGATVFHCANVPYHMWADKLPIMMDGLLAGTEGRGIHLVYMDNYYAFGNAKDVIIETTAFNPVCKKGVVRAKLAVQLQQYAHTQHENVSIVRSGDIYGPGVENATFGARSYQQILRNKSVDFPVPIEHPHCFNYVKEVAEALQLVGDSPPESDCFGVWNVPYADYVSLTELVALGAQAAGTHSTATRTPEWLVKVLSLFIPVMKEFKELEYEFDRTIPVSAEKFEKIFSLVPVTHKQAMEETIRWTKGQ